ncbi:MAG: cation diffusion facilitator family transporter, partial [Candidatus Heimdallarchaeota archaeon]
FIIMATGFVILDPLVSIGISLVILYWSYGILKDSTRILLEMSPKGMDIDTINNDLKLNFPEIMDVDDAHLWTIIPGMLLYSAHIRLNEDSMSISHQELLLGLNEYLSEKFKILESTIQILPKDTVGSCNF